VTDTFPPATAAADAIAVTVIVVTHDVAAHAARSIACLAAQTLPPARLVVIDSGSHDGSVEAWTRAIDAVPGLRDRANVRPLGTNVGFAAASNLGIATAETPLVALLNPDAFPEPDWLERLAAAAAAHPRCASFASRQMLDGHPGVLDGLGDHYHLAGIAWRGGHGRVLAEADLVDRDVFSACAAAALYRRDAVLAMGGFDDDYFCYVEDVDLGFRLRLAGHGARLVADAVVAHIGQASSRDGGRMATSLGHRNLVWTHVKNMPSLLLAVSLPALAARTILTGLVLTARGHGGAYLEALRDAAAGLPACWTKRRAIQQARVASTGAIWRVLDKGLFRRG
jgi:GT2 family glycosyltransferase